MKVKLSKFAKYSVPLTALGNTSDPENRVDVEMLVEVIGKRIEGLLDRRIEREPAVGARLRGRFERG